jgi:hypothetical protein
MWTVYDAFGVPCRFLTPTRWNIVDRIFSRVVLLFLGLSLSPSFICCMLSFPLLLLCSSVLHPEFYYSSTLLHESGHLFHVPSHSCIGFTPCVSMFICNQFKRSFRGNIIFVCLRVCLREARSYFDAAKSPKAQMLILPSFPPPTTHRARACCSPSSISSISPADSPPFPLCDGGRPASACAKTTAWHVSL